MSDVKEIKESIDASYYNKDWKAWVSLVRTDTLIRFSTSLSEKEAEIERIRNNLNQAIEALEYILTFPYLHETDDIRAIKRTVNHTIQSIKGGESDATQTSNRSE